MSVKVRERVGAKMEVRVRVRVRIRVKFQPIAVLSFFCSCRLGVMRRNVHITTAQSAVTSFAAPSHSQMGAGRVYSLSTNTTRHTASEKEVSKM